MTLKQKKIALYVGFVAIMLGMSLSHARNAKKFEKKLKKEGVTISNRTAFDTAFRENRAKTSSVVFLGTVALSSIAFFLYGLSKNEESTQNEADS